MTLVTTGKTQIKNWYKTGYLKREKRRDDGNIPWIKMKRDKGCEYKQIKTKAYLMVLLQWTVQTPPFSFF
jgi:hypothetical protein